MKLSDQFVYRYICGEAFLTPVGETTKKWNGIFTLSETGAFILEALQKGLDEAAIADELAAAFEISPETAAQDTADFLRTLSDYGILTDN